MTRRFTSLVLLTSSLLLAGTPNSSSARSVWHLAQQVPGAQQPQLQQPSLQQTQPRYPEPPMADPKPPLVIDEGKDSGNVLTVDLSCRAASGSIAQTLAICRSMLAAQQRGGDRIGEIATLTEIADLLKQQNQLGQATVFYKQAVNASESVQKSGRLPAGQARLNLTMLTETRRSLADTLLLQKRVPEALQAMELMKLQEMREFTSDTALKTTTLPMTLSPSESAIVEQHNSLIDFGLRVDECKQSRCSQLSQLNDQLQVLIEDYNRTAESYEKEIRQRRAEDDAFLDPTRLPKLREIVEAQPGTVLIYPLVMDSKIWLIWVARGGVVKSEQLSVTQQQVGTAVQRFRDSLQSPTANLKTIQSNANQLYEWMVKPLAAELKAGRIQHLVFALDRATRYIPVSALFDGNQYLIENYTVSTILSADLTDLRDRLPTNVQSTAALAMGASEFSNFSPLPNVPAELDAIVRQQASDRNGIYPGQEFLNKTFDFRSLRDNLLGHKILHIATHAAFVPGRPEQSYLVLGTGETLVIPRIKTLQDLSNIHLVVLSACETALGAPGQNGIEISGVSFYFLSMGAKAVMASLWTVDDASTSYLMQQFYANLAQGTAAKPITKAVALQQAQLSLLRGNTTARSPEPRGVGVVGNPGARTPTAATSEFARPYYWAPFTLIGNGL